MEGIHRQRQRGSEQGAAAVEFGLIASILSTLLSAPSSSDLGSWPARRAVTPPVRRRGADHTGVGPKVVVLVDDATDALDTSTRPLLTDRTSQWHDDPSF